MGKYYILRHYIAILASTLSNFFVMQVNHVLRDWASYNYYKFLSCLHQNIMLNNFADNVFWIYWGKDLWKTSREKG